MASGATATDGEGSFYRVVPTEVLSRWIAGEVLILRVQDERYFGLDGVGAEVWTSVLAGESVEDMVARLSAIYGVDDDVVSRDVRTLLGALSFEGLVQRLSEPEVSP